MIRYMQCCCYCATVLWPYTESQTIIVLLSSDDSRTDIFFPESGHLGDVDSNGLEVSSQTISNAAGPLNSIRHTIVTK
jgi:hypothetical protein